MGAPRSGKYTGIWSDKENSRVDIYYGDDGANTPLRVASFGRRVDSVTQATNRTTAVTSNGLSGTVTGDDASLAAVTIATHTVNNSAVAANDCVVISKVSGDADSSAWVSAVAGGSFNVSIRNHHASGADTTAFVYNYIVLKSAT